MTSRRRFGSERGRLVAIGGFAAVAVVLWLGSPAGADDNFPSVGPYSGGLTAESSWADILKARGIQVEFPMLNVGNAYVPLSAVCVDAGMVRAVTSGHSEGRVSAPPATNGYHALRADALEGGDPFAIGAAALPDQRATESPHVKTEYLVTVYQDNSWFTSMHAPLFQKVWVIPDCRGGA